MRRLRLRLWRCRSGWPSQFNAENGFFVKGVLLRDDTGAERVTYHGNSASFGWRVKKKRTEKRVTVFSSFFFCSNNEKVILGRTIGRFVVSVPIYIGNVLKALCC